MPRSSTSLRSRMSLAALSLPVGAVLAACGPGDDGPGTDCTGLLAGDLVITEVFADADAPPGGSGADEGKEWFEIYNASTSAIDLKGVVINHGRPDGSSAKTHTMPAVTVGAGEYFVLTNTLPDLVPAYGDHGYGSDLGDLFNQDGGKFTLMCGPTELDHALYELVEPGFSRSLDGGRTPDYQINDDPASWCQADATPANEYTLSNFGTPGAANQDCMNIIPGMCDDGGTLRPTVAQEVGDLTITEVMPNPDAVDDDAGEWFEVLFNRQVDLNGVGLDREGDAAMPVVLSSPMCLDVSAGVRVLFARSMDSATNGGLQNVDGLFNFSLVTGTAANPGDVRLMFGATELDQVTWTSSRMGRAIQLAAGLTAPTDNDVPGNLCDATTPYGAGDLGTPRADNVDCGPPVGMCMDTVTMQMRPIVKPTAGQISINEWMSDSAAVADTAGEWFEIKATADVDLNGLQAGTATLPMTPIVPVGGPCLRVAAGGFALFAHNNVPAMNGGLPMVDGTFTFALTQANGMIRVGVDGNVLSMVMWAASTAGKAFMIDSDGTQCTAPAGVASYNGGMDFGTPRAANTPPECP